MRFVSIALTCICLSLSVAHAGPPQSPEDDAAAELIRQRALMQKQFEAVNQANPMSEDFQAGGPGGVGATAPTGPFAQLQALLQSPMAQKMGSLMTNPEFTRSADAVIQHPNRMMLLYCNIGLVLTMFVFRAWRYSKTNHWARKLWINVYSGIFLWGMVAVVVPRIVLGEPYFTMLGTFYRVLRS